MPHELFLSIGEHRDMGSLAGLRFMNGNREIVATKNLGPSERLIHKGLKQGFSEIVFYAKDQELHRLAVFVTSKLDKMKMMTAMLELKKMGLLVQSDGPNIKVIGEISQVDQFQKIHHLKHELGEDISFQIQLSKKLRQEIFGDIYHLTFNQFYDEFYCRLDEFNIICFEDETHPLPETSKKYLKEKYAVLIVTENSNQLGRNFRLKLKVIQMENGDGHEINWGLSKIEGNLEELMYGGIKNVISKNRIALREQNIELSTLAEPIVMLQTNREAKIDIGSDIPYTTKSKVEWKFAGLRLNFKLEMMGSKMRLIYTTELGSPGENGVIASNRQESSLIIRPNSPIELYQIGYETKSQEIEKIPGISEIPILGELFKGKNNAHTYKKLSAVAVLEEIYESE